MVGLDVVVDFGDRLALALLKKWDLKSFTRLLQYA